MSLADLVPLPLGGVDPLPKERIADLLTEAREPKAPIAQFRKVFSRARGGPRPGDAEAGTAADGDSGAGPRLRQLSRRLSRG